MFNAKCNDLPHNMGNFRKYDDMYFPVCKGFCKQASVFKKESCFNASRFISKDYIYDLKSGGICN